MVRKEAMTISSVVFTRRAVAGTPLRPGGNLRPQDLVVGCRNLEVGSSSHVLG